MESIGKDHRIRVKNKFANHVKFLAESDSVLSNALQLQVIEEDHVPENEPFTYFGVKLNEESPSKLTVSEIQSYVNTICDELEEEKLRSLDDNGLVGIGCSSVTGEDSSYDSDYEGSEEQIHVHDDVSRTVSDTLGQEFAEYVSTSQLPKQTQPDHQSAQQEAQQQQQPDFAYQSKLEFALKLGYTEKLVQVALQKLGPNPEQNELLAELIKLGAHQQSCAKLKNDLDGCDNVDDFVEHISSVTNSDRNKLRPIVIDGSNVAMSHGNKEVFSCRGIRICVDWFRSRGHTEITVFVPKWRKEAQRPDNPVIDQDILHELERERLLVFTPSREFGGKRILCYDDRYILKLAADNEGIVVSNDNYRDLIQECPEFRKVVEERILMYSFVNDRFMPPDDPLGRSGPTLENFLKMPALRKGGETCPYGKKCTYGNKCKYNHPERGLGPQKSVTERLVENAQKQLLARNLDSAIGKKVRGKSISLPLQPSTGEDGQSPINLQHQQQSYSSRKQPLSRTKSTTVSSQKADVTLDLPKSGFGLAVSHHTVTSPPSPSSSYYRMLCCQMNSMSPPSPLLGQSGGGDAYAAATADSGTNRHRKLQRQFSINPTCDPSIYQTQRRFASSGETGPPTGRHMPIARHYSCQEANYLCPPQHSNVTRISSAPPAANPAYTMLNECTHASSSEPQLNRSVLPYQRTPAPVNLSAVSSSLWSVQQAHPPSPTTSNYVVMPNSFEETRRKLHYHLASIFPEEQVDAAMLYYPNETNPQKICAAILSMFSSKP